MLMPYALFPFQGQLSKDRKRDRGRACIDDHEGEFPADSPLSKQHVVANRAGSLGLDQLRRVWAVADAPWLRGDSLQGTGPTGLSPTGCEALAEWFKPFGPTSSQMTRAWPTVRTSVHWLANRDSAASRFG